MVCSFSLYCVYTNNNKTADQLLIRNIPNKREKTRSELFLTGGVFLYKKSRCNISHDTFIITRTVAICSELHFIVLPQA